MSDNFAKLWFLFCVILGMILITMGICQLSFENAQLKSELDQCKGINVRK
jgi:hypothetical protein